jgi:hypothetical protein
MKRYYQLIDEYINTKDCGIWEAKRMAKKRVIKEMMDDLLYHEWKQEDKVNLIIELLVVMNIEVE